MPLSNEKLVDDLESFAKEYFKDRKFFGVNYGSYASDTAHDESDLDLFFATPEVKPEDIQKITSFIVHYHIDNRLQQDEEVPYDNKLVVSYDDIAEAVQMKGLSQSNGRIIVPPIIKDEGFLASLPVRYRLLYNSLTSPHHFFGDDFNTYNAAKSIAEENLVVLAHDLHNPDEQQSIESMVEKLLRSKDGQEGEMFLGYKRNPSTIEHLTKVIRRQMANTLAHAI